jgi:hypothetical protein
MMTNASIIRIGRSAVKAPFTSHAASLQPLQRSGVGEVAGGKSADGDCMATWILYRKGSFSLKERISSAALFERRKAALEQQGATHVRMAQASESNWLRSAFELPRPAL